MYVHLKERDREGNSTISGIKLCRYFRTFKEKMQYTLNWAVFLSREEN